LHMNKVLSHGEHDFFRWCFRTNKSWRHEQVGRAVNQDCTDGKFTENHMVPELRPWLCTVGNLTLMPSH
jgi:hypothetical protein